MAFENEIDVRYCETDAMGHINNVSYFIYFEQARVDFFRHLAGADAMDQFQFVLVSAGCDYIEQAYFGRPLTIRTVVSRIGNKSFTLDHEVVEKNSGKLIARGRAVVVVFDTETGRAQVVPDILKEKMEAYLVRQTS